jgi:hypothetical protein
VPAFNFGLCFINFSASAHWEHSRCKSVKGQAARKPAHAHKSQQEAFVISGLGSEAKSKDEAMKKR